MKTVSLIIIFLGCVFISASYSNAVAQNLVPGMHGISTVPGVKFVWIIISNDHELSLNIRYAGNGTTPPVALSATAIANPKMTDGYHMSMPTTIGTSQVLNAGWSSSNNTTLTFNENPSLLDADLVTIVASPYTSYHSQVFRLLRYHSQILRLPQVPQSSCDPSYPDFCIAPPPPPLNCDDIAQKNFRVSSPDPHGFDKDKDGIGCDE